MASGWLSGNCELAIAPICWSRDNGTTSFVSGGIPSWPTGAYQPVEVSGFTAGCGYIYGNSGFGHVHFDGTTTPSGIMTNYPIILRDASVHTWETVIYYKDNKYQQTLMSAYQDANNYWRMYIYTNSSLRIKYRKGAVNKLVYSNETLDTNQYYHLVAVKDGGDTRLYINGSEVTYASSDTYNLGDFTVNKLNLGNEFYKGTGNYPLSGDIYWTAVYDEAMGSGAILHHATELDFGMDMVGTSGGTMTLAMAPWPSEVDPSGISLPTHGIGPSLSNLASFGYGGGWSKYYATSYYDATGKKVIPAVRANTGPIILRNQDNGQYLGKYYITVIAQDNGEPLNDLEWIFYAENVAQYSGAQPHFKLYPQSGTMLTDNYGIARYLVDIPTASGLPDFVDKTGTSGQYISMWGVSNDTNYITYRIDVEYRVI